MKDPTAQFQLPEQMSTAAEHVDWLYTWIWWISLAFFVVIVGAMVYFAWKFRKRRGHQAEPTGHNLPLELAWTVAPIPILILLFHFGFKGYMELSIAPQDAEEIHVRAHQWGWEFEYPNGATDEHDPPELHVPLNKPVKIVLTSIDVLHAFYVPAFRVKRDVVPGMYTSLWFTPTVLTKKDEPIDLFCAEYCGGFSTRNGEELPEAQWQGHWSMITKVHVDTPEDYAKYLEKIAGAVTPEKRGEKKYKSLCSSCHSVDGSPNKGPTWKGLWGKTEKMRDGQQLHIEGAEGLNYVTSRIYTPSKMIPESVQGPSQMTVFTPDVVKQKDIEDLIAYMKTLK